MRYIHSVGIIKEKPKRFIAAFIAVAFVAAASISMISTGNAATSTVWDQGFETNTDGWFDSASSWHGTITRVSSGTDSIDSASGSYHGVFEGDASSAPFSRFDEYRNTWSPWTAEIDVYLDPSWAVGTGFDYSVAASGSDGNHQRDYIFHVTKDTSTGKLLVAGSNNTNFTPREDLENIKNFEITSSGWYTLQHVFYDDGGALSVNLNLLDSNGSLLFTETRSNPADVISTEIGGNRYAWFTFINVDDGIAVDDHQLFLNIPDPVLQYSVNGGGHILEQDGNKRKDWKDISIGLDVMAYNTGVKGTATIRFHNTSNDDVDKTTFHAKQFTSFNFFNGGAKCDAAMNFTALGEWNGYDNATIDVRASDNGDSLRVILKAGNIKYDTHTRDFKDEINCVGSSRTLLDNGNITIKEYL